MSTLNTLIIGNYNDLRGDSAIYLLERAPSGSCNVYFSGTTGSLNSGSVLSSTPIISHPQGNFTASINQLNWNDTAANVIFSGSNNTSPVFDLIIYHQQDYGDWQNQSILNAALSASLKGVPVFTQHYNDVNSVYSKTASFYGFPSTINIGWGNYATGSNSGSYGNELEFYDTINDGKNITSSVLLYSDNKGLTQTENFIYIDNNDVNVNELNAVASVAAKYIKLVGALSSSYAANQNDISQIYANHTGYTVGFYYDLRQYLRQVSLNYNTGSVSGWSPTQGYGTIQIQTYTGSNSSMPDITSSINFFNLSAGSPLLITVTSSSLQGPYIFSWQNFYQSEYASTTIKVNNRTIYTGTDSSYTWVPDVTTTNAVISFYTNLVNGIQSVPESNSIISLGLVTNQTQGFSRLNYGYSCANNGNYIAVSSTNKNKNLSANGIVDVLQYSNVTNTYQNLFLVKKLVDPSYYNICLITEDATLDATGSLAGDIFLTTEISSSYNVVTTFVMGAQQSGSTQANQEIQTGNNQSIFVQSGSISYSNDPLDLQVDSVFNLIDSYNDSFGTSVSLYQNLLAVGCPYYNITFTNGQNYAGSTVDIYDLNLYTQGLPYYPVASIQSPIDTGFGESVSLFGPYLVVGSSTAYSNVGAVLIYQMSTGDETTWNLIQTIYGPSINSFFGGSVKFDQSGNGAGPTLVVGNSNTTTSSPVYIYYFNNGQWTLKQTLNSNTTIPQTLPYLNNLSPILQNNVADGFGNSVSIYGGNIIVGAPTDTVYQEYVGQFPYKHRGAVYFYQTCSANPYQWQLIQKDWGNQETLINGKLGFDVDIYQNVAIASVPKYSTNFTSNYIISTLNKRFDCNPNDSYYDTLGQVVAYNYSGSSWNIEYTQQKIKDYGIPYLNYGYSNALYNQTFVVGAPCFLTDPANSYYNLTGSIQGYSYIYNLNNLISNKPVGNVFYRDGKIVLSNSGSIFSGLMKDKIDSRYSKYDLTYTGKVTLYEKQILCTVNPSEFNCSTNPTSLVSGSTFDFAQLDLTLKYINYQIYGNYNWWNNLTFNDVEQSLFSMYVTGSGAVISQSVLPYYTQLSSSYMSWDVDGNDKINLNDMTLIWKYFAHTLTQNDVFTYIEPKSTRKTLSAITGYIQTNVVTNRVGEVNPQFFAYNYSSSVDNTGSYLAPYITTVGLYSGADLVGVAKLANPVKNGGEFPLNILIKWDI